MVGGLTSISLSLWIMFGQVFAKLQRSTLPSPISSCWNTTGTYNFSLPFPINTVETTTRLDSTTFTTEIESE